MPEAKPTIKYSFLKRMGNVWFDLIGNSTDFTLEARVFHSISIGLVILGAVYVPYNFFAGLYIASASCVLVAGLFYFQYYNSRFLSKPHSSVIVALMGIFVFSINYFSNSGINGSTDLIWPHYFLLVLVISPYRQHLLWLVVYIVAFFFLHLIEFHYPSLVRHPFDLGKGEFIDRVTAFPLPVIGTAIVIGFLRRSYDKERAIVEEKARTIELRNREIMLQRDELEQSNAEKNKLLSIISHDLRAPFVNIHEYLSLLNETEFDGPERQVLEDDLRKVTDQTMGMISNLLYWAKSQMEGVTVNLTEINLLDALKETLEIEKIIAGKKDITLGYDINAEIVVVADIDMLQLVARNLINNAVKFTPKGGAISIDALALNDKCKISVRDNGRGIAQDKADTMFLMTSGSTFGTNNEKGVGLGLPLCKEFMERQGGSINFESTPRVGSHFFIFLPLGMPPPPQKNIL